MTVFKLLNYKSPYKIIEFKLGGLKITNVILWLKTNAVKTKTKISK